MTEYNFMKEKCDKCHKVQFCIETYGKNGKPVYLCEMCFGWNTKFNAWVKDEVREILIKCGMEDIENDCEIYPTNSN